MDLWMNISSINFRNVKLAINSDKLAQYLYGILELNKHWRILIPRVIYPLPIKNETERGIYWRDAMLVSELIISACRGVPFKKLTRQNPKEEISLPESWNLVCPERRVLPSGVHLEHYWLGLLEESNIEQSSRVPFSVQNWSFALSGQ